MTNTGTVDLTGPMIAARQPIRDGSDRRHGGPTGSCADVDYVSGDLDEDLILDATGPETWVYECTTTITGAVPTVRNTAVVVAETVDTDAPDRLRTGGRRRRRA